MSTETMTAPTTEVVEMGDGAAWLVKGTVDPGEARDAVVAHLVESDEASQWVAEERIFHAASIVRSDWFWREHKDGDDRLCIEETGKPYGAPPGSKTPGLAEERSEVFEGVYVV